MFRRIKKARDSMESRQLKSVQRRLDDLEGRMNLVEKQVHVIKRDS